MSWEERIKQHIDALFSTAPDVNRINDLKNEIYLNTLDRYRDLLAEGKTEEEAENAQLIILSVGEDDEGEYLAVVDDDELLLELGKLFEERLSDEYDIEE